MEENAMAKWTVDDVALRFSQAADVARRLPSVRVQGYFNCWPEFKRDKHENLGIDDHPPAYFPPSPDSVEKLLETMRWVLWLEEDQRHLVWMRAKRYPWKQICRRFGCDRTTAWRRWQTAILQVTNTLNAPTRKLDWQSTALSDTIYK
jgi:hypothetical protein